MGTTAFLIVRTGSRTCALPLSAVRETFRTLPAKNFAGLPDYLWGVCRVRGEPVPVADLGRLLGDAAGQPRRLVSLTLPATGRRLAVAVEAVVGVHDVDDGSLVKMPPILASMRADAVSWIGFHDSELLLVLDAARLVPEDAWDACSFPGEDR